MIVCSRNVFSDNQVRSVVAKEAGRPRMSEVYAAVEHGEVRSVVALKPGVGDHTHEKFADHELRRNANHGGFSLSGQGRWIGNRLSGLTH